MVRHSTLAGVDNHPPLGVAPYPLSLAVNTSGVYAIQDTAGETYLQINSTTGAEHIFLCDSTLNQDITIQGTGEVDAVYWVARETATDPGGTANRSKIYAKEDGTSTYTELFHQNSNGDVVQITNGTSLVGAGDLDAAYNYPTAHLGRTITIDAGFPVHLNATSITNAALDITGWVDFGQNETVLGGGTHSTVGTNATILGADSDAGSQSVGIGYDATCSAANSICIGTQATASHDPSIVIGRGPSHVSTKINQLTIGSSTEWMDEAIIGGGDVDGNGRTLDLRTSNGTGTNNQGWGLNLTAGLGTGTAQGGPVALRSSIPGSTGATLGTAFNMVYADPSIAGASSRGELALAANEETDPVRYTHGHEEFTSVSSGTISIVDLTQHTNNTSQVGWIKVTATCLDDANRATGSGSVNAMTVMVMSTFVINSTGTVSVTTAGSDVVSTSSTGTTFGFTGDIDATSGTLEFDWSCTGADVYDINWIAEWFFGPAATS